MKKTLLFIFSLLTLSLLGQDGINYQGAATDANGDELTNQNISIRASVLSASANGNLEWEETHSTTTDQFGLFNVVIGQGTNTTNGATATFDDMDWGSADHYLKIEMDATGGTNYAMIGTTQMMSVPYALYAKSAGIDSTMLANMIGSSGGGMGGGCDWLFPDGLDGEAISWSLTGGNDYTVPAGKNLYITVYYGTQFGAYVLIDGISLTNPMFNRIMIAGSGSVVSTASSSNPANFNGFLVDANVSPIVWELGSNDYTVPNGKKLYITHITADGTNGAGNMFIDGVLFNSPDFLSINHTTEMFVIGGGSVISDGGSGTLQNFIGYLADENYFTGCGGGSSSSASAVDSAMVAGMIAASGGGGSLEIDTFCYNYDASYLLDTITIQEDGFIFVRRHSSPPTDAVFYLHYGYNLEEYMNIVGSGANTKLIPIKSGMKIYISGVNYNNTDLDVFFIPSGGGGSSSSNAGLDSATVASMIANAGPKFITPITIYESYNVWSDTVLINIDSLLQQNPTSIILNIEAEIVGSNNGQISGYCQIISFNGLIETPVCDWFVNHSGAYHLSFNQFSSQVIVPNNQSNGFIELRLPLNKTVYTKIKLVGYY